MASGRLVRLERSGGLATVLLDKPPVNAINRVVTTLYSFPLPTVAAINGHAIAGGFILAPVGFPGYPRRGED